MARSLSLNFDYSSFVCIHSCHAWISSWIQSLVRELYNKSHARPRYKMLVNLKVNVPRTKHSIEWLNFENCNMLGYMVKI